MALKSKEKAATSQKLRCIRCGEYKTASIKSANSSYYRNNSPVYKGNFGYIPICKDCLRDMYDEYKEKYDLEIKSDITIKDKFYSEKKAVRRLCSIIGIYYSDECFELSTSQSSNMNGFTAYMRTTNLIKYNKKNYDNTIAEDEDRERRRIQGSVNVDEEVRKMEDIDEETIKFFGVGFSEDDYKYLQEQYDDWTTRHECKTKTQEEIFKQICFTQLDLLKAQRAGENTKDLTATYLKQLDAAKLQPKQNKADTLSEVQTFGTLIDKWETTRPLPEIDSDLRDVDNIGLYIDVFFRGHLAKMMGMKNGYSNLYDKYMEQYTVNKPEYANYEDDDEALFDALFGKSLNENYDTKEGDSYEYAT